MLIYLLRHGKAEDLSAGGARTDDQRALTAEGRDLLARACRHYARLIRPPDRLRCSPLVRARQSAEVLAEAIGFAGDLEEERELVPGARPTSILDRLQIDLMDGAEAVGLVGHEPHLGNLLGLLLTGSEQTSIPLQKGMLAGVRVREPQTMVGRLVFCMPQEAAAELA